MASCALFIVLFFLNQPTSLIIHEMLQVSTSRRVDTMPTLHRKVSRDPGINAFPLTEAAQYFGSVHRKHRDAQTSTTT